MDLITEKFHLLEQIKKLKQVDDELRLIEDQVRIRFQRKIDEIYSVLQISNPDVQKDDICYKCASIADHYSTLCHRQLCSDCNKKGHRGDVCFASDFQSTNRKYGIVADQHIQKTKDLTPEERLYVDYCVIVLVQKKIKKDEGLRRSGRLRKERTVKDL